MAKILKYDNEAKQKILAGIEKLEKAVSTTLGPAGKNVIIDEYGSIHSTKDGVTVAKSIVLKDPFEKYPCFKVRQVIMSCDHLNKFITGNECQNHSRNRHDNCF